MEQIIIHTGPKDTLHTRINNTASKNNLAMNLAFTSIELLTGFIVQCCWRKLETAACHNSLPIATGLWYIEIHSLLFFLFFNF